MWKRWLCRLSFGLVSLLGVGCGAAVPLERLPNTELVNLSRENFSVSPDGNWLIYIETEYPSDGSRDYEPVLYNVSQQQVYPFQYDSRIQEMQEKGQFKVIEHVGCWKPNSTEVVWRFVGDTQGSSFGIIDVASDEPTLVRWIDSRTLTKEQKTYYRECPDRTLDMTPYVRAIESETTVRLVDARQPDRVLAEHRAQWFSTNIKMPFSALAPDKTAIVYTIHTFSSPYVNSTNTYFLSLREADPQPRLLATDASGPAQWMPDSRSVLLARPNNANNDNVKRGIYQWHRQP